MFRHPKYLEIPWEVHWQQEETAHYRHVRWLTALLILAATFFIGVRVGRSINN